MSLVTTDGNAVRGQLILRCDVVVVGSGPGGATVARDLAEAGVDVVVVEAGRWVQPHELPADPLASFSTLYAGGGFAFTRGRSPMQLLYGRALGGTSVVNSAICWPFPRSVYDEWVAVDPALADALPWESIERASAEVSDFLGVQSTDPLVAGANNLLMARGADRLGWAHRPIRRNTLGCEGMGRCNSGCPKGAKLSMDRSMLPAAVAAGARIVVGASVDRIVRHRGRARWVEARASGGGRVRIEAGHAVVLAAGAISTPVLLLGNHIGHGPVGRRLQGHPGVTVAGRFDDPVRAWQGATQGHEITELMRDRIKLEALGLDAQLLAVRLNRIGPSLVEEVGRLENWANWAGAVRARSMGRVAPGRAGPKVRYELHPDDVARVRRTVAALGDVLLAAGAVEVSPGVAGFDRRVTDASALRRLETDGPTDPRAYTFALSHLFGTCRMGTDPRTSVVGPDFRHHAVDGLYVADASVFPTNLGVNPQISIMALATCCARSITKELRS